MLSTLNPVTRGLARPGQCVHYVMNHIRGSCSAFQAKYQSHVLGAPSTAVAPSRLLAVRMASSAGTHSGANPDRKQHNVAQQIEFGRAEVVKQFTTPLPEEIQQRLKRIVDSVPGLCASSRVVDVGTGTGCLIPHMQNRGVKDILAVDLSAPMLEEVRKRYAQSLSNLGNETGVRTWQGDIVDLPDHLGWGADAVFFNGCFGNMHDPRAALLRCTLMMRPGAYIVISHPMGETWHRGLAKQQPHLTPHLLPGSEGLKEMLKGLPLSVVQCVDEPNLYITVLQIPPKYALPQGPLKMEGPVVTGFGRGSRQMGTPTANIDPTHLKPVLAGLDRGVYFGWARLDVGLEGGWSEEDLKAHKMVMNVGRRPTVNTGDEAPTVEAHIMHTFSKDFYGQNLKVVALGYIRPEMRFPGGLPELVSRINTDKAIASTQLDDEELKAYAGYPHLA